MAKSTASSEHLRNLPARDPLLKTKLYIPLPHSNSVPRPRLIAKLAQGLTRPLTLISAPAGFGKTTLIGEWHALAERQHEALAWLALDDDDNDPARFWAYVIAALQTQWPVVGVDALEMLHADWPQSSLPKMFLTSLINELAMLAAPGVLALDDYHVIESKLIHDSVTYWLDHLPPQLHLVIASRIDPPLPLARLRARNQLVEIRAADLRFTPEEAASFLNQVTGLGLTPEDVAALEARTEGWIAGLQLAAIALQARTDRSGSLPAPAAVQNPTDVSSFIAAFTGSNRYVLDYLVEEVLRRQSDDLQSFLLQTSILEQLCGPLCDAVTERSNSQAILEQLEQSNLFTTPLDEERRWYRYHHLFAEFLYGRLAYTQPGRIPELHRRAADWHERNGLIDDAIAHALDAQEWTHAARLIEQVAQTLLMHGEMVTLYTWLHTLPDELVRMRPRLCVAWAWTHILELRIEETEDYLLDAEQIIMADRSSDSQEHLSLLSEVEAIRSVVAVFQGDTHRAAELAQQAMEHSSADNEFLRSIVAFDTSLSHAMDGDARIANQSLQEAFQFGLRAHNMLVAVIAMTQLAEQHIAQGQLHRAADLYRQAIQLVDDQTSQASLMTSLPYTGLGEVLREWNRFDESIQLLHKGIALGQQLNEVMVVDGYVSLARLQQAQGDTKSAMATMQKFHELAHRLAFSSMMGVTESTLYVRLWIAQGNLAAVAQWLQESARDERNSWVESTYPYLIREMMQLALVHAQLALGRPEETLALIEQLQPEAETRGRVGIVIELTMLKALALQALGETDQAFAALQQALLQAEPEGYMRLLLDKGEPLRLLLADFRLMIEKRSPAASAALKVYVDKLLAAFSPVTAEPQSAISHQPSTLNESPGPLSERELEVLRMIAEGLSNQEIADRLVVAPSTIKTHIKNLYNKLGVNSRVQALTRAQELGLL